MQRATANATHHGHHKHHNPDDWENIADLETEKANIGEDDFGKGEKENE